MEKSKDARNRNGKIGSILYQKKAEGSQLKSKNQKNKLSVSLSLNKKRN